MAKREVTVTINGEETVSTATNAADGAMGGFAGKIPGWAKTIGLLTAAYQIVTGAIGMAKDYVLDSFAAYDRLAGAHTKLAAQAKLTGIPLAELNRIADDAKDKFGLSTTAASELAGSVGRFASKAGDSSKAGALMAAALDLGAASSMNATEIAEGLTSALAGNDEWLNRLGLANPSQLWKDYADANGRAVKSLTDTEQKLAVMTAIMDAGNQVAGTYAERMASGAGAQDALNNKLDEAKAAFGQALQPARIFIVQGLSTLVEHGAKVVLALARVSNALVVGFTGAIEGARAAVGYLVMGIGKLTGNKELEAWGRDQSTAFSDFTAQMRKLEDKYLTTGQAATESASTQKKAGDSVKDTVTKTAETVEQQAERMNRAIDAKLGKPMQVAIELTEGAIKKLGQAATDQLPTVQSEKFLTHMQGLVTASGAARDKIMGIGEGTTTAATKTKDMAREVETFARGALDAAGAFGVIDETAQRSLNSAINIASSIKSIATSGFSFAGVTGVIGGVASIVSTMMQGDVERRRLQSQNNSALAKLSKDIGGLKFNISGEDFAKAQTALGGVIGNLRGGRGAANENDVRNALYAQGLTMEDFDRIAREFGIEVRTKSGALNVDSVKAVFDALGTVSLGRVGQGFDDQLEFFKNTQRINGNDGPAGTQALIDFLRNTGGVRALDGIDVANDPAGALSALKAVFTQMGNGEGLSAGQLGRLTGSQLSDILMELIDGLMGGSAGSGGTITVPDGVSGGGTVSAPTETIQSVIGAMNTNLGTILTTHTTLHERIALATEGSYSELMTLNGKMDRLIEVTSGSIERTDTALEQSRRLSQLERGILPVLR